MVDHHIFKTLKDMCINSYETLYESYILPILGYGAEVWGYNEQSGPQVLSNRVKRFYLGVNSFTPVSATSLEFDWPDVKTYRWTSMIRYLNRLKDMTPDRWPKKILSWDLSLRTNGWSDQITSILNYVNMECDLTTDEHVDLAVCYSRVKNLIDKNGYWKRVPKAS